MAKALEQVIESGNATPMGLIPAPVREVSGRVAVPPALTEYRVETGPDMSSFPSAGPVSSWAHVCPGNHESAGKRNSGATGRGNPWLRSALVEAAQAASRTKGTYLSAQYHRLAARRGHKRAILAVAHTILVTLYTMLRNGTSYRDLGDNYFDERNQQATLKRSVHRIERLVYKVTLETV